MEINMNFDYIELVYDYSTQIINILNESADCADIQIRKTFNQKLNKFFYTLNGVYDISLFEPKGIIPGRVYVKIKNKFLYNDILLKQALRFLFNTFNKSKLIGINRLDIALDIINYNFFEYIDLNKLDKYTTSKMNNKKIYLENQNNDEGGKSLYFNVKDFKTTKNKKQRASGIIYTKSILLGINKNDNKTSYQNPNDDTITRIELRLSRAAKSGKEVELLNAILFYFLTDIDYFFENKETIFKFIFNEYKALYSIYDTQALIDYNTLFDDDDFKSIQDFIDKNNHNIQIFNIKKKTPSTKMKTPFNKKLYKQKLESILTLYGVKWKDYITDDLIKIILNETNVENPQDLEYTKVADTEINNQPLYQQIHFYIITKAIFILDTPIEENDFNLFD